MTEQATIGNHKNLSLDDRFYIEKCLSERLRFNEIAKLLNRNPKTISREIKSHRTAKCKDPKLKRSKCAYRETCTITNLCSNSYCKKNLPCVKCKLRTCSQYCERYVPGTCPKLLKPPYTCNGCEIGRAHV